MHNRALLVSMQNVASGDRVCRWVLRGYGEGLGLGRGWGWEGEDLCE